MPTANLGRVGFVNKGAWSDGLHKINDLVTFGTAKYACILQHTSVLGDIIPTNTTYWEKWTDYGTHSVTNIANTVTSSADSQYVNYFSGTNTGVLSIKITGLVTATASTVDLGFMEITVTQDDRDHSSTTNPPTYKFMVKGNMDVGVWYNCQAVLLGTSATVPINVRFTRTTSDAYIEIGETSSTWYYPTVEVAHVSSYIITGYTPVFLATIQASLLGTTSDFILSAIPNSTKNENTLQSNVVSATTCTIGTYLAGDSVHITGTTTITSLGVSTNGTIRKVTFDDALVLTHNATSLILPTGANIATSAGDTAEFVCENGASGYWKCTQYQRKNGTPLLVDTAVTQSAGDNSTKIATTAFVQGEKTILQSVYAESRLLATGTAQIPYDDTIPQQTEGTEILTISITPKSTTSRLRIKALLNVGCSATAQTGTIACFKDAGADAIIAMTQSHYSDTFPRQYQLEGEIISGTTSAITFKIRFGMSGANTYTINGYSGARKLGGVQPSFISIEELV